MAGDTADLRNKARRVKNAALTHAIDVLENPSKHSPEVFEQTYLTVLKNAVPRSQEITGEDGEPIQVEYKAKANAALNAFLNGNNRGDTTQGEPAGTTGTV